MGLEEDAETNLNLRGFDMKHVFVFIKRLNAFSGKVLYFNLLGMGVISLLEGVGIFLLVPLISMSGVIDVSTGATPISKIFGFLQDFPKTVGLPLILCFYICLVIGQNLLQRNLTIRNVTIIQGFIHHLRLATYRALLQGNWHFFIKKRKSDLINLFTAEMGRVTGGINTFLQLVSSLIFTLIQVALAFWLAPMITLFVLMSGLVLAFFSRKFIKSSKKLGNKTSELAKEYLAGMTDQLNGIKDIKSNALEESRLKWLHSLTQKMLVEQVEYIELKTASQLFYKIASAVLIGLFIFLSVKMFHAQPEQFLLIIVIFSRLWPKVTSIQSSLEQMASATPAFKALIDLEKECQEQAEVNQAFLNENIKPLHIEHGIECRHVSFRYNLDQATYALRDITCHIPANRMTAIVGRSGAGKSTLIDMIMGMMQPEKGDVFVDGAPLSSEKLLHLRKSMSYVPQDPFLFNGSIKENLLMIEPNATDEEIWEALAFSQSAEFVRRFPQRLDTVIGDRGVRLSGGERQRLVLARVILKKPAILVLDEATSALDTENEMKVQEAIEKIRGTMTIVVIAHRLSTIRHADQVIVLEQGEIIQTGGFSQLANEKSGMFSHLLGNQIEMSQ